MSLKKSVISGVKWTSLSSIVISILQLLQISILARYLSAEDFGLMAIVMVVIGFSRIFSDMGISNAIIHHQHTSHEQLSSLYWLNIASGVFLFFIVSAVAPFVASFYSETELTPLLILLASTFIIFAVGNQYRILFQKKLNFNVIAKIEITSALVAFIVAIYLAVSGYGVYALVYGSLSNAFVSSSLYLFFGLRHHRPSFIFKYQYVKPYLGFGMYQTAQSTLNYFNSQFDVILIGKLLGAEALGIYSIVKQLAMKPAQIINPIVTKVMFPILAKVQDDKNTLKYYYLQTINAITTINFPIYILMAILAEPIVRIVFGEEWIQAIPILQILSIYFMIRSIGNPVGSLVMATGKVHLEFWWNVGMFVVFPFTIYLGSFWGLKGIAYSLVVLMSASIVPMWFIMIRPLTGSTLHEYTKSFLKSFFLAIIASIFTVPIFLIDISLIMQSLLTLFVVIGIYIYFNYLFNINIMSALRLKDEK